MKRFFATFLLVCAACGTGSDSVCDDIGYCRAESDDQVTLCQTEAKELRAEAALSGCAKQTDDYYACAAERYQCNGNLPSFAGCETVRSALDLCLSAGRAGNACGQLAAALRRCPNAPAPDPSIPPAPCGASELCAAHCYSINVADACAPTLLALSHSAQCARACP